MNDVLVGRWVVDSKESEVCFTAPYLFSTAQGTFSDIEGHVIVNDDFSVSDFNAAIAVKSIDFGRKKYNALFNQVDLFDSETYPSIVLSISELPNFKDVYGTFTVVGDLNIRGKSLPARFESTLCVVNDSLLSLSIKCVVDRRAYEIGQGGLDLVLGSSIAVEAVVVVRRV